ncbi:hypothetical protein DVH24_015993 [Malus domestica]|uniref:Uncharacterized protein n=1 Tax=Malus domestica TaxID=3750 RepID=A0A498JFL3_MALDO|nr:hypothetical protein DVH24_015993 [Malus domestica]
MCEQDIYYSSYKPAQPFDVPQREGNKKLTNKLYDLVKHFKYPFSYPQLQYNRTLLSLEMHPPSQILKSIIPKG